MPLIGRHGDQKIEFQVEHDQARRRDEGLGDVRVDLAKLAKLSPAGDDAGAPVGMQPAVRSLGAAANRRDAQMDQQLLEDALKAEKRLAGGPVFAFIVQEGRQVALFVWQVRNRPGFGQVDESHLEDACGRDRTVPVG